MADLAQLERALINADAAGDSDAARVFAAEIQKMRNAAPMPTQPTQREDKGILQNLALGALKGSTDEGTTLLTPADWAYDKTTGNTGTHQWRKDKLAQFYDENANPDSLSFKLGSLASNIAGTAGVGGALGSVAKMIPALTRVAPALPAALESGGMSLGGATASTAGQVAKNIATRAGAGAVVGGTSAGLINPDEAGIGAAIGAVMPGAIRTAGEVGKAAKAALIDPLINQDAILGGAISRAVGNASGLFRGGMVNPQTAGVNFSLGQQTGNGAINAIEDALKARNPGGLLNLQEQANRTTLADFLRDIGQSPEAISAAKESRSKLASPLYEQAWTEFDPHSVTPWVKGQVTQLMKRPAMQQAMSEAQTLAQNLGMKLNDSNSVQGLHFAKMALDDQISAATRAGNGNQVRALQDTMDILKGVLDKLSPTYRGASEMYAEMSRPINQMQIGQYLSNKLIPSTSGDIPATLNAASLATALRNPDQVAKTATGFSGAKLSTALDPDQLASVMGVSSDASRIAEMNKLGAGFGSPTARRLAVGDFISDHLANKAPLATQVIGQLGGVPGVNLPLAMIKGAGNMLGSKINAKMAQNLEEALAKDPQSVQRMLNAYLAQQTPSRVGGLLDSSVPALQRVPVLMPGLLSPANQ